MPSSPSPALSLRRPFKTQRSRDAGHEPPEVSVYRGLLGLHLFHTQTLHAMFAFKTARGGARGVCLGRHMQSHGASGIPFSRPDPHLLGSSLGVRRVHESCVIASVRLARPSREMRDRGARQAEDASIKTNALANCTHSMVSH